MTIIILILKVVQYIQQYPPAQKKKKKYEHVKRMPCDLSYIPKGMQRIGRSRTR